MRAVPRRGLLEPGHPYAMRPKPLAKASVHAYMRAINSFLAWVRKHGFAPFAVYRIVVGAAVLAWAMGLLG